MPMNLSVRSAVEGHGFCRAAAMNIIKPPARDVGRSLRSERYKEMSKIKKLIDGINAGIQSIKERGDETDTITMTLPGMQKAVHEDMSDGAGKAD